MEIKVFGMENCAGCVTVKNILNQKGIEFVERDVMNVEHMEEAQKHGVRSVPTTVITHKDGVDVFVGSAQVTLDLIKLAVEV